LKINFSSKVSLKNEKIFLEEKLFSETSVQEKFENSKVFSNHQGKEKITVLIIFTCKIKVLLLSSLLLSFRFSSEFEEPSLLLQAVSFKEDIFSLSA